MRKTVGVVLLVGVAAVVAVAFGLARPEPVEPSPIVTAEARVVVTDLVETATLSGDLRYSTPRALRSELAGIVTRLPAEGDILAAGSAAFEVGGVEVIVLVGERPAWRPLREGVTDGADVLQLETNLADLGHLGEEPDEVFDDVTADAVEAWRADAGLPEGREIELGRVVFLPGPVRVARTLVDTGATVTPGLPVLEVTEDSQEVLLAVDPDELDLVPVGSPVVVRLPDGTEIDGVVASIASTVRSSGPDPTSPGVVDVTVELRDAPTGLDLAPVEVDVETDRAAGVMAVPVRALLALSDGGYAVERRVQSGTELVGVEIGAFAGGLVEIRGAVSEGDVVVIPG